MKKFFLILTVFLCFVAIEMSAQSDYTPCLPDCENDVWIPDISLPALKLEFVTLCGTEFTVRYRYRIACNQWYDYYLEGVETTGSGSDIITCIHLGYSGSMALFMQAISEALMIANPANFPPHTEPDCELMWRVLKGGCWFRDGVVGSGIVQKNTEETLSNPSDPSNPYNWLVPEFVAPCPSIHCCLEMYRVCMTSGGLVITLTDYQPPMNPECVDVLHNPCKPVCGSVYNR